jgi:hypothetical protein
MAAAKQAGSRAAGQGLLREPGHDVTPRDTPDSVHKSLTPVFPNGHERPPPLLVLFFKAQGSPIASPQPSG